MKVQAKVRWLRSCILVVLFFLGCTLPSARACSPEVVAAIAQLQKSAKAKISADAWLSQIVDKASLFRQKDSKGEFKEIKVAQKDLQARLFHDKRSLDYLRRYLVDVKIRQDAQEPLAYRTFLFEDMKYTYFYQYITPSGDPDPVFDDRPDSTCLFLIYINVASPNEAILEAKEIEFFETTYIYFFALVDGKMKIIKTDSAG